MRLALLLVISLAACAKNHCEEVQLDLASQSYVSTFSGCAEAGIHKVTCRIEIQTLECSCGDREGFTHQRDGEPLTLASIPSAEIAESCGFTP